MNCFTRKRVLIPIVVLVLFISTIVYLKSIPLDTLIITTVSTPQESFQQKAAQWTLYNLRKSPKEIKEMEQSVGLNFIIAYQDSINIETFEWLLDNGANINAISPIDSLPPLHAALLYDNMELIDIIMERGADTSIKGSRKSLTPCEFLELLKPNKAETLYSDMIEALGCVEDTL